LEVVGRGQKREAEKPKAQKKEKNVEQRSIPSKNCSQHMTVWDLHLPEKKQA